MNSFGEIRSAAGTQSPQEFVDSLVATLPPIYAKENTDTVIQKMYLALAEELVKSDILLESVANNNYISVPVTGEITIRGSGTHDRLKNENAFELDNIRLTSPNSVISQNTILEEGDNEIQLFFIPQGDIDFLISSTEDPNNIPVNFPTSFDFDTNILSILASRSGKFTITYQDTGDVVRLNENITVPAGLFRLGWSEGGWNELGWGE